jgi:heme-degrading monooxygenase HmoA
MAYVRLSIMKPLPGSESELHAAQKDLLKFFAQQPGFVDGYILRAQDGSGEVGRVGIWESESHADHAANSDHVLAVRSELMRLVREDNERSFLAD